MVTVPGNIISLKTTSYRVVLPFYGYAALSFLAAALLIMGDSTAFNGHYFHPHILAITHILALGWGTMIILGASHQLVPILIEGSLYSEKLALASFILAGVGIPLLSYGFYNFEMGWPAKWGGRLVLLGILCYLINLFKSISGGKQDNVHALFVFTAGLWLFITAFFGLVLVYNFTYTLLLKDTLYYLPLHAHIGIMGWFLLLIMGVASRLIPMFLISKYHNTRILWVIYLLINTALLVFLFLYLDAGLKNLLLLPALMVLTAVFLFMYYCFRAFKTRLRKQVDPQLRISLFSIALLVFPLLLLLIIISLLLQSAGEQSNLVLAYGFLVFFGWITAIVLGMTFKTLPFIVWNKVYHHLAGIGRTPNPKDLFNEKIFRGMILAYLAGLFVFTAGVLATQTFLLKTGAVLLLVTAGLYSWNVFKLIFHKRSMI